MCVMIYFLFSISYDKFVINSQMINHIFRKGYFQIMPSSGPSLTHEEYRSHLCVCCGLKQKKSIAMTEAEELLVKIHGP